MKAQRFGTTAQTNYLRSLMKNSPLEDWNYRSIEMNKALQYKVFCLESYKSVHNVSGSEALDIFNRYNVFTYLERFYDMLHTTGRLYIVNDIDEYIAEQKAEG
jgi:hypothetical protein